MEAVNGVTDGGPPPPSPLTGCYLLIVLGEPHSHDHKDIVLQRLAKGLLSWDINNCLVDLEKELSIITEQALEGEESKSGERLIQFASENLVTEILIHPSVSTLVQCIRNLLSSFTRHRHIIHSGYTFAGNGSWILQDGTFSYSDFAESFQEIEVQRVIRAYENGISIDMHFTPEGDWTHLPKESFTKSCKLRVNPNDVLTAGSSAITNFTNYIARFLIPADLDNLLESSDVVGNIRFSRPTLYVFPGGQGDAALFGINGFNMLVDGGFSRKACFWDFVRHLDRLDAVMLTRLNNSNVCGLSAVLRRKRRNALYPQIGHFFCNVPERKCIPSPDGDKDRDPLLVNLFEEGQEIISNARHLNLNPQACYRETEPINLYHKVGHGTLDMYVISPSKDAKEVREFLQKWNNNDQKLFSCPKSLKDLSMPLQNLVSLCALLVWQPADPNDTITRILFPGSAPQNKIFEGLDKLKHIEAIRYPICTAKSLTPHSTIKSKQKDIIDKLPSGKQMKSFDNKKERQKAMDNQIINDNLKNGLTTDNITDKVFKKSDSTESDKSSTKPKAAKVAEISEKVEKPKPRSKIDTRPPKGRSESQQRKKTIEKKSPTTTTKKIVEAKAIDEAKTKPIHKSSPTATPAKSTKDANNRRVVESKIKAAPKKEPHKPAPDKKEVRTDRKPISRKIKETKELGSPVKKVSGVQKPDSISKRSKFEKEVTTDSSTVSTPSVDQESVLKKDIAKLSNEDLQQLKPEELADLKEEQEAVKEIEAVFIKSETKVKTDDEEFGVRKIQDESITKNEPEDILIVEKIEVKPVSEQDTKEDEIQKLARDSEESEKQRSGKEEIVADDLDKKPEVTEDLQRPKKETHEAVKETSAATPEDKVESTDKKGAEKDVDEDVKEIPESQRDEKVSGTLESGATTTAPTLPEDEKISLDEIKESNGDLAVEEKHVKEETKERDIPLIQLPPKSVESSAKLPPVVGIKLDKQNQIRDIVKTPDEVADLPVHEEVDAGQYGDYDSKERVEERAKQTTNETEKHQIDRKPSVEVQPDNELQKYEPDKIKLQSEEATKDEKDQNEVDEIMKKDIEKKGAKNVSPERKKSLPTEDVTIPDAAASEITGVTTQETIDTTKQQSVQEADHKPEIDKVSDEEVNEMKDATSDKPQSPVTSIPKKSIADGDQLDTDVKKIDSHKEEEKREENEEETEEENEEEKEEEKEQEKKEEKKEDKEEEKEEEKGEEREEEKLERDVMISKEQVSSVTHHTSDLPADISQEPTDLEISIKPHEVDLGILSGETEAGSRKSSVSSQKETEVKYEAESAEDSKQLKDIKQVMEEAEMPLIDKVEDGKEPYDTDKVSVKLKEDVIITTSHGEEVSKLPCKETDVSKLLDQPETEIHEKVEKISTETMSTVETISPTDKQEGIDVKEPLVSALSDVSAGIQLKLESGDQIDKSTEASPSTSRKSSIIKDGTIGHQIDAQLESSVDRKASVDLKMSPKSEESLGGTHLEEEKEATKSAVVTDEVIEESSKLSEKEPITFDASRRPDSELEASKALVESLIADEKFSEAKLIDSRKSSLINGHDFPDDHTDHGLTSSSPSRKSSIPTEIRTRTDMHVTLEKQGLEKQEDELHEQTGTQNGHREVTNKVTVSPKKSIDIKGGIEGTDTEVIQKVESEISIHMEKPGSKDKDLIQKDTIEKHIDRKSSLTTIEKDTSRKSSLTTDNDISGDQPPEREEEVHGDKEDAEKIGEKPTDEANTHRSSITDAPQDIKVSLATITGASECEKIVISDMVDEKLIDSTKVFDKKVEAEFALLTDSDDHGSRRQSESSETVIIPSISTTDESMVVEKIELGRKSPKEREGDVAKIVASVAEVLKSDAPLEEFKGKLPFTVAFQPYTTELRETHITTCQSPTEDEATSVIPEETKISISTFLDEERKISDAERKEAEELDVSKVTLQDLEDSGMVHRMLVTTSSEDGGEEIEICPAGSITFVARSSESSGRSSPDQKLSPRSSIIDTASDSLSTVKQAKEIVNGRESPSDDLTSDMDRDSLESKHVTHKDEKSPSPGRVNGDLQKAETHGDITVDREPNKSILETIVPKSGDISISDVEISLDTKEKGVKSEMHEEQIEKSDNRQLSKKDDELSYGKTNGDTISTSPTHATDSTQIQESITEVSRESSEFEHAKEPLCHDIDNETHICSQETPRSKRSISPDKETVFDTMSDTLQTTLSEAGEKITITSGDLSDLVEKDTNRKLSADGKESEKFLLSLKDSGTGVSEDVHEKSLELVDTSSKPEIDDKIAEDLNKLTETVDNIVDDSGTVADFTVLEARSEAFEASEKLGKSTHDIEESVSGAAGEADEKVRRKSVEMIKRVEDIAGHIDGVAAAGLDKVTAKTEEGADKLTETKGDVESTIHESEKEIVIASDEISQKLNAVRGSSTDAADKTLEESESKLMDTVEKSDDSEKPMKDVSSETVSRTEEKIIEVCDRLTEETDRAKVAVSKVIDESVIKVCRELESTSHESSESISKLADHLPDTLSETTCKAENVISAVSEEIGKKVDEIKVSTSEMIGSTVSKATDEIAVVSDDSKERVQDVEASVSSSVEEATEQIAVVFDKLGGKVDDIKLHSGEVVDSIKDKVADKITAASAILSGKADDIKESSSKTAEKVGEALDSSVKLVTGQLTETSGILSKKGPSEQIVDTTVDGAIVKVADASDEMKDKIDSTTHVTKTLYESKEETMEAASDILSEEIDDTKQYSTEIVDSAVKTATEKSTMISEKVNDEIDGMEIHASEIFGSAVKKTSEEITDKIGEKMDEIKVSSREFVDDTEKDVKEKFTAASDEYVIKSASGILGSTLEELSDKIEVTSEKVSRKISDAKETVSDTADRAVDKLTGGMTQTFETSQARVNGLQEEVSDFIDSSQIKMEEKISETCEGLGKEMVSLKEALSESTDEMHSKVCAETSQISDKLGKIVRADSPVDKKSCTSSAAADITEEELQKKGDTLSDKIETLSEVVGTKLSNIGEKLSGMFHKSEDALSHVKDSISKDADTSDKKHTGTTDETIDIEGNMKQSLSISTDATPSQEKDRVLVEPDHNLSESANTIDTVEDDILPAVSTGISKVEEKVTESSDKLCQKIDTVTESFNDILCGNITKSPEKMETKTDWAQETLALIDSEKGEEIKEVSYKSEVQTRNIEDVTCQKSSETVAEQEKHIVEDTKIEDNNQTSTEKSTIAASETKETITVQKDTWENEISSTQAGLEAVPRQTKDKIEGGSEKLVDKAKKTEQAAEADLSKVDDANVSVKICDNVKKTVTEFIDDGVDNVKKTVTEFTDEGSKELDRGSEKIQEIFGHGEESLGKVAEKGIDNTDELTERYDPLKETLIKEVGGTIPLVAEEMTELVELSDEIDKKKAALTETATEGKDKIEKLSDKLSKKMESADENLKDISSKVEENIKKTSDTLEEKVDTMNESITKLADKIEEKASTCEHICEKIDSSKQVCKEAVTALTDEKGASTEVASQIGENGDHVERKADECSKITASDIDRKITTGFVELDQGIEQQQALLCELSEPEKQSDIKSVCSSFIQEERAPVEKTKTAELTSISDIGGKTIVQETLKHDKDGLDHVHSSVVSMKDYEPRSSTPGSDDYETMTSTHSDISSGQVSRLPHVSESERFPSDDEDDLSGSPLSTTSQIVHSRSPSHYDFEQDTKTHILDPMSMSCYGTLPDEPCDIKDDSISKHSQHPEALTVEADSQQGHSSAALKKEDIMTSSFIKTLPSGSDEREHSEDPIASWGKPLKLPSPAPPTDNGGTPKKERKVSQYVSAKNKLNDDKKRADSPSKQKGKKMLPVYVDLTYVPHHGNALYSYVDFFKRIRARYYVFSGIEPSKEVYAALLEAKQTWEDKDLEVTIIPTYDTDILGYWVAENEELLSKYKIDLSPSASRCTINLQDHETSCSAYRLEF